MNIKVLFFGITTDLTGEQEVVLQVNEELSINDFKSILKEKYSNLEHLDTYALAVNEAYVSYNIFLKHNDVVAIIPPVSGG